MKVIVTGGRNFTDVNLVWEVLSDINPTLIIHGKCKGADTFASEYAELNGIKEKKYPYPSEHGRAGGPIRNKQMIDENKDAMLLSFPGGKGTANCTDYAKSQGMCVIYVGERWKS